MREARLLSSVPVLLFFAAFLVAVITAIFTVEVLINEVYEGTGQRFLSLLPTILFAGLVPQVCSCISTSRVCFADLMHVRLSRCGRRQL